MNAFHALPAALLAATLFAGTVSAKPAAAPSPSAAKQAAPTAKLAIVALTGPEDMQMMTSAYRHATAMKKSGALAEVSIVVYGRAINGITTAHKGLSDKIAPELADAIAAGVKVYACAHAMEENGIAKDTLLPGIEVVPQGAVKTAELAGAGATLLRY